MAQDKPLAPVERRQGDALPNLNSNASNRLLISTSTRGLSLALLLQHLGEVPRLPRQ
jgi:hypothetical protein